MSTVKEIKTELDRLEIEYSPKALKPELEALLMSASPTKPKEPVVEPAPPIPNEPVVEPAPVVDHEDRPRNIKAETPEYIDPYDDFVDPNASPATQA